MTPCRQSETQGPTRTAKLTIKALSRLAAGEFARPDSQEAKPIPVCSQINKYDKDQLWTSAALPVDGLVVRLRRFRKSHHFVPAGPDPDSGRTIGELQSAATRQVRAGTLRA